MITIAQAVEAIRTADTVETIAEALQRSGKVKEMCAAFKETVGERYYGKTVAINKEELALNMAFQIMHSRENEAFKALSLAEKCARLSEIDPFDAPRYVHQCKMEELKKIANMLGVKADYDGENILQAEMSYGDAIVKGLILNANNHKHSTETSQPEVMTLKEIYHATKSGKFERMPVSEKMRCLQATADIYHRQTRHEDDCGFYDMFRHCKVKELEEIARISGVKIPESVYVNKEYLNLHLQWYMNVKVYGVDTTPAEIDYVNDADYWVEMPEKADPSCNSAMVLDWFESEIDDYERGKLTEEEMTEIVKYAPIAVLRAYARENEIPPVMSCNEREGLIKAINTKLYLLSLTLIDVSAGIENYECGKLTAEELAEILDLASAEVLREYILQVIVKDPPEVIKIPA